MKSPHLLDFLEDTFLAERQASQSVRYQYRNAIKWLHRTLLHPPTLADLNNQSLTLFLQELPRMGVTPGHTKLLHLKLLTIWRFAAERGVADRCPRVAGKLNGKLTAPVGDPGTLLAFFNERYLPEVLGTRPRPNPENHYALFRSMREWLGGDLRMEHLSAAKVAEYVEYLRGKGMKMSTVNTKRILLLANWRYAAECGVAPPMPRMKQLKVEREAPIAWSVEEVGQIINAAMTLQKPPIGGVPANLFWNAALRIAWWTALRRGTIFSLRWEDIDLENGWITVPALVMKNARGQRVRIGTDAIEALQLIRAPIRELVFPLTQKRGNWRFLAHHLDAILKLAGVKKGRQFHSQLHQLRRSSITHTCALAGDQAAIQLAGHSSEYVNRRYLDHRYLPGRDATAWLPSPTDASTNEKSRGLRIRTA
jgi:integrase